MNKSVRFGAAAAVASLSFACFPACAQDYPTKAVRLIVPLTAGSGALAEQGLANFDMTLWFGVWAPTGTPATVVNKINRQITAMLQLPEVREQFAKLGISPTPMKPEEFARFVREQIGIYQKIVKSADIQPL